MNALESPRAGKGPFRPWWRPRRGRGLFGWSTRGKGREKDRRRVEGCVCWVGSGVGMRYRESRTNFCCLRPYHAWKYRFSSDHRSQATSGSASTWMGDRLGIPSTVGIDIGFAFVCGQLVVFHFSSHPFFCSTCLRSWSVMSVGRRNPMLRRHFVSLFLREGGRTEAEILKCILL